MAATRFLLCFILYLAASQVHSQVIYTAYHVAKEGSSVTLSCHQRNESYTTTRWAWYASLLRSYQVIFHQSRGGAVTAPGARPDISLNTVDWSITVGSLQVQDSRRLYCVTEGPLLHTYTELIVYNKMLEVKSDSTLTLQCPVSATGFTSRQWITSPYSHTLVYNQNSSGITQGPGARADMSLNSATFDLTIGHVSLQDYTYTCSVTRQGTMNIGVIFSAIYRSEFEVEEGTSVTLSCDRVVELTSQSRHPYTRKWQRMTGAILYHQFRYEGAFHDRPSTAGVDMALNNETFALSISSVRLGEDSLFLCTFHGILVPSHVESVKLIIYINPEITLSGLDDTSVSVGTTVTVTCTIDRVYPELGPEDFQMRWGTQTIMSTGSENNDKSFSYTVQFTHTVTEDDNGTLVECLVNQKTGQPASTSRTVITHAQNQNTPLLLPVIGGAVAAAAVLIIVIVIGICIYVRKKHAVTDQTSRPGESCHQQDRDVPDVNSQDGTYEYIDEQARHAVLSDEHPYENLRVKANTPVDEWFEVIGITKAAVKKLKRHNIITIQDLQDMSRADMVEAGLNVGDRNKIKRALKEMGTSRF